MKLTKFVDFGLQTGKILVVVPIEEWLLCIMRGRELESRTCALRIRYFAFQLTTYIYFLNPARRPQSRKGRLAADALRQRRDGMNNSTDFP